MPKPNLKSFERLFQSGKSFSITEEQYQKDAGLKFPKQPYLQKSSAVGAGPAYYDTESFDITKVNKKLQGEL